MPKQQLETEPQHAAQVATVIPLGRLEKASEIVDVAVLPAGDGARTMTGSTLLIDVGCSVFQFD